MHKTLPSGIRGNRAPWPLVSGGSAVLLSGKLLSRETHCYRECREHLALLVRIGGDSALTLGAWFVHSFYRYL